MKRKSRKLKKASYNSFGWFLWFESGRKIKVAKLVRLNFPR